MNGRCCPHIPTAAISYEQLEVGVLHLPLEDRTKLVSRLSESLEEDESFSADELQIFNRRSLEICESTVKPLMLEELQRGCGGQIGVSGLIVHLEAEEGWNSGTECANAPAATLWR